MKLEEKRRHIEQEKRKMEIALGRQQQKVGKAAFLQAINKVNYHTLFAYNLLSVFRSFVSWSTISFEKT